MSDSIEETPQATEEVTTEEVQADPIAEAKAALEAERAELEKLRRDLQKGFQEVSEREKAVSARTLPDPEDASTDPDLEAQLRPYFDKMAKAEYGERISAAEKAAEAVWSVTVNAELARVAADSGIPADELTRIATELELRPKEASIEAVRDVLDKAVAFHRGTTLSEADIEARLREKILAELAETGEKVEAVRPQRGEVGEAGSPDPETDPHGYYRWLQSKK